MPKENANYKVTCAICHSVVMYPLCAVMYQGEKVASQFYVCFDCGKKKKAKPKPMEGTKGEIEGLDY